LREWPPEQCPKVQAFRHCHGVRWEDAFLSAVMFTENSKALIFMAEFHWDWRRQHVFAPAGSFHGVGRYGESIRATSDLFHPSGKDGGRALMSKAPMPC